MEFVVILFQEGNIWLWTNSAVAFLQGIFSLLWDGRGWEEFNETGWGEKI